MNSPIFNIQESFDLYTKLTEGNNAPKHPKISVPYRCCYLTHRYTDANILYRLQFENEEVCINIFTFNKSDINHIGEVLMDTTLENNDFKVTLRAPKEIENIVIYLTGSVVFTLNLMNCKNIEYVAHDPNTLLCDREKRYRKINKKSDFITYRLLKIKPMKFKTHKINTQFNDKNNDLKLHTVRGHFKTFTSDNPLFGKFIGTYWWCDFIKGDIKNGLTIKDYSIRIDPDVISQIENLAGG